MFYALAALSVGCSIVMVIMAYGLGSAAFLPLVPINWLLFMGTSYLAFPKGKFRIGQRLTREKHIIVSVVMITFTVCGLIGFALTNPYA